MIKNIKRLNYKPHIIRLNFSYFSSFILFLILSTIVDFGILANNALNYKYYKSLADDTTRLKKEIVNIGNRRQLFIDDYIIERLDNISRRLNEGEKYPDPVVLNDNVWERNVNIYGSVIEDEGKLKMWYRSNADFGSIFICYAESEDGITWTKPDLGIIKYNGNYNNNIILEGIEICSVIRNKNSEDYRKYILYAYNKNTLSYETYWSEDGISNYQLISVHKQGGDVCSMAYDDIRDEYVVSYKISSGGNYVYKREFYNSTTRDFINYTEEVKMHTLADSLDILSAMDALRVDCYGLCVLPYEEVYIGFDWLFYITDFNLGGGSHIGPINVQLAFSRDIRGQWYRPVRKPIIPLGVDGEWDDGMIFTASSPIIKDDQVWLYYAGYNDQHKEDRVGNIGLVKWRLDGFMSLENNNKEEGVIETKLLRFKEKNLAINCIANDSSSYILVELLDENGDVIPGFSKNECTPINTDNVNYVVRWGSVYDLTALINTPVTVKMYTKRAKVFALQFGEFPISINSVESNIKHSEDIRIFPNPASTSITLNGEINGSQISIYNVNGSLFYQNIAESDHISVDLSEFANGIYIIKFENKDNIIVRKFVKN